MIASAFWRGRALDMPGPRVRVLEPLGEDEEVVMKEAPTTPSGQGVSADISLPEEYKCLKKGMESLPTSGEQIKGLFRFESDLLEKYPSCKESRLPSLPAGSPLVVEKWSRVWELMKCGCDEEKKQNGELSCAAAADLKLTGLNRTLLHYLGMYGNPENVVGCLKEKGASFNVQESMMSKKLNTALCWAIANGNFSMAKRMIIEAPEGTDFDIVCGFLPALHIALMKGYTIRTAQGKWLSVSSIDLMRLLLGEKKNKINVNAVAGKHPGNTLLHIACLRRDAIMIDELLKAPGGDASVNVKNEMNKTPYEMLKFSDEEAHDFLEDEVKYFQDAFRPFTIKKCTDKLSKDQLKKLEEGKI